MASGISTMINVSNLEKTVEFYKGLGLRAKVNRMGDMTWGEVWSGSQSLGLADKNVGPAAGDAWLDGELGKGVLLNVFVPDAAKTYAKAKALRAPVEAELDDQPWGGKGFMINDPDGYVLMFSDRDWNAAKPKKAARKAPRKAAKPAKKAKKAAKRRR